MSGSKNTLKAHLALLGANLLYGLNYVIAKGMMPDYFAPRAIILIRVSGALLFFWLFDLFNAGEKVKRKDLYRLALCALFGVATNQILFFEGLNLTTPINASLIMLVVPILVLMFSRILLGERITKNKITGIFIGLAGAAILILSAGKLSFASDTFTGNVLVFINAAAFGFYLVLVKPMMLRYRAITVMKWVFLFGFIYVTPLCIHPFMQTDFTAIPLRFWFSLAYVIIGTTILAYLLFNYSLKHVSPVVSSMYMYSQPLIASVTAVLVGMDFLKWQQGLAAVLVFTGVYFVSIRKNRTIRK